MKRTKTNINRTIDLLMVLLLPLLMAYSLIGEAFHEVVGTVMFVLFIAHLVLHWRWWKALPRGKYTVYRIGITVLNLILLVLMLAQPLSGVLMSRHLYTFLHLSGVAATARDVHLVLGCWSYVMMSMHLGLHARIVFRISRKREKTHRTMQWVRILIVLLISAYGIFAFIHRGFPGYMLMQTRFAFFDFSEPIQYFIADYLAIMALFAALGHGIGSIVSKE